MTQKNSPPGISEQVEALIEKLTLEQKVALVSDTPGTLTSEGDYSDFDDSIPEFVPADGPAGVRIVIPGGGTGQSTRLPAPVALAASWDTMLAEQYGDIIGREMAATGHTVLFGPACDIARVPVGGRTFESFGEDPLLQSRMIVPEVEAIQRHGIQTSIKHYILNNQEYQRTTIDVHVDERTLHEIYLPPFEAAITQGGAASVMGSYNKVNGVYVCENPDVLARLLREELGFDGWVVSDFLAIQSTAASVNAGVDKELGGGMWGDKLLAAVEGGEVFTDTIDTMARRILTPALEYAARRHEQTFSTEEHGAQARAIAEQGMVLLKNDHHLLPLSEQTVKSIAVIGADADNVSATGGGSANVVPTYGVSVLDGLRNRAGGSAQINFAPGTDPVGAGVLLPGLPAIPSDYLTTPDNSRGVQVEYWRSPAFEGEPDLVRVEPMIEMNWGFLEVIPGFNVASPHLPSAPADLHGRISSRWTGFLTPPIDGDYTLSVTAAGSVQLQIDGEVRLDSTMHQPAGTSNPRLPHDTPAAEWGQYAVNVYEITTHLEAGHPYAIQIDYAADTPGQWAFQPAMLRLGWAPPGEVVSPTMQEAVQLAQRSDVAVVVVRTFESEEFDRPDIRLPQHQDQLIRLVGAANPHTVVVIMSGAPVEIEPWGAQAPAILEAWYAGQEQGNAVARVLFGDVNPSGKLPITFPRGLGHTPVSSEAQYPGVDGVVSYSEGLRVGYRGYDALQIDPTYPFGHGLSYTAFSYDGLEINPGAADIRHPREVRFTVTNTGERAGAEVAQVYVGLPPAAESPPRQLAGWAKVWLEPGESREVTVFLDPLSDEHPLSYWDATTGTWVVAKGTCGVYVGTSSRSILLKGQFEVT